MIADSDKQLILQYRQIAHLLPLVRVLLLTPYPAPVVELSEGTSANQETVRMWLRQLQVIEPSPVTRVRSGWALTPKGKRLFLDVVFPQVIHMLSTGNAELSTIPTADHPRLDADDPRFLSSGGGSFIQFTTTLIDHDLLKGGSSKSTKAADDPRLDADDPRLKAIFAAFEQTGLATNTRTIDLALMEHITPAYVRAMYADLKRRKKEKETGLLITLLEENQPLSNFINLADYVDRDNEYEQCAQASMYAEWEQ